MKRLPTVTWVWLALLVLVLWLPLRWLMERHWYFTDWLVLVAVLLLLCWMLPKIQTSPLKDLEPKTRFELENEARKTLTQIMGGSVLLIGLFFTWQNLDITQRTTTTNLAVAQQSLRDSQKNQLSQLFARATEQLGSDKIELRIGAIYSLEQILRNSDEYRWPTVELLAAFIRERARWKKNEPPPVGRIRKRIAADAQAAITVLGRRERRADEKFRMLDLRGVDLSYAEFTFTAGLPQPVYLLNGACLDNIQCSPCDMRGVILAGASLKGASFWGANLAGVPFVRANLEGADLTGANLKGALFDGASLKAAILKETDLRETIGLTREQIESAITDAGTKLPAYLQKAGPPTSPKRE